MLALDVQLLGRRDMLPDVPDAQKRVPPSPSRIDFAAHKILDRLAFANEGNFIPSHERFRGKGREL